MATFGERLKELRMKHGLTQSQLGDKIGYKIRMVQFLEANEREPSLQVINNLCELFDCTADYLLGRVDDPKDLKDVMEKEFMEALNEYSKFIGEGSLPEKIVPDDEKLWDIGMRYFSYLREQKSNKDPQ